MIVAEIDETSELKQKFATVAREKRLSSHITQERLAEMQRDFIEILNRGVQK